MKLILANNQSQRFTDFYKQLQAGSSEPFDYASYDKLLFVFDNDATRPVSVRHIVTGRTLTDYDGVYLNGYLDTYELAATMATACQANDVSFVNAELGDAPSLSKLTAYAKLAADGVKIPRTVAGAKAALMNASEVDTFIYPAVLKRADADRGIDNFKVATADEARQLLTDHDDRSIWILQSYIENDGFYLVSFYGQKPAFGIHRTLEDRPDNNPQKAHMFKPKGGANATLLEVADVPEAVMHESLRAMQTMNRQIGSVDSLFDGEHVYVLEVNYNPQMVTIETFKDVRIDAFLNALPTMGQY